ncbi:MAG: NYN domain-containing protein [Pirellulaceae bacterium]
MVYDTSQPSELTESSVPSKLGIEIRYATEHDEADDLIEELIRRHPQPKRLRVISSDARIRRCARAKRAKSIDSDSFLQYLEHQPPRSPAQLSVPEVADDCTIVDHDALPSTEVDYWLREFGHPPDGER